MSRIFNWGNWKCLHRCGLFAPWLGFGSSGTFVVVMTGFGRWAAEVTGRAGKAEGSMGVGRYM